MAQPPFLLDVLQIEPGSGDTLTISRDSTDGAMSFVDAVLTSGVLLPSLVGLRNVTGVFLVGRAGDGAPYTTIQSALDEVSTSSSVTAPSLVLVLPGVYTENLTIQKDGVYVVGLGGVKVSNSGASDTVEISAAIATTPQDVMLRGLTITNDEDTQSCVRIIGADSFATADVDVDTAPLATSDTVTINGTDLTGTAGPRTSGSDDFSVSGTTTDTIAAELVDAINDTANSFATLVEAESSLNVVTLTAVTAGSAGNSITLAVSTTPAAGMVASAANLSGGGASGSLVGDGIVLIEDCVLVSTGSGGYQVNADTSGHIRVRGGTFRDSASNSISQASNCAAFRLHGVEWANDIELAYDTTSDRPDDTTCEYDLVGVGRMDEVSVNLSGAGTLSVRSCPEMTGLSQTGDQTLDVRHSSVGALTLNETVTASLRGSERTTVTVAGGTPTLQEPFIVGSETFTVSGSQTVTLEVTQPDASYTVLLENPDTASVLAVTNKTTTTFDIEAVPDLSGDVGYTIMRNI